MKRIALLITLAAALMAQETISNGIRIKTIESTEGISVFVTPSGCNTDALRVQLRTSKPAGNWDTQQEIKTVVRCDMRPVEFRFALPGSVVMISAYELSQMNAGSSK